VHQDGLVHVSALANRFVADPREVVKSGQVVRVKVLEADPERKRISLTLRLDDEPAPSGGRSASRPERPGQAPPKQAPSKQAASKQAQPRKQAQPGREAASPSPQGQPRQAPSKQPQPKAPQGRPAPVNTAMAEALRKAGLGK
jgi:uncharacterized protein